ncbi:MAG: hypothetical protein JNJ89_07630 [Rubrivivax sp.]|nr:hypothetical protein [Rubrivivax sp.]
MPADPGPDGLPKLSDWLTVEQLQERYREYYPSINSIRWALRVNRPHLLKREALAPVGRRKLIHPERFEAAVIDAGIAAAGNEAEAA